MVAAEVDTGTRPLVSIVLPTHNGSRYLAASIESCLRQTLANWELIIVDDCSSDDTPKIIERFVKSDSRIRSIHHAINQRIPKALNSGFGSSRGRFLTWTSDDNLYEPDALNIMVAELTANPNVALVYANVIEIGPNDEVLREYKLPNPDLLRSKNCVHACFLYRREAYDIVGDYSEDMFLVEDWDYWIRISKNFGIKHLENQYLYRYRHHPSSLTSRRRMSVVVQSARLIARHYMPAGMEREYVAEKCGDAVWRFHATQDFTSACYASYHSLKWSPWSFKRWKTFAGCSLRALAYRKVRTKGQP